MIRITTNGGFLISQIKQVQGRVFGRLLQQAGMDDFNGAQGRILFILWQNDCLPIVELSRRTGLAKTTLTGMLDRLETQGLVCRSQDRKDRRQQRIMLTDRARALSAAYDDVSARMNELFYRGFSEPEAAAFEDTLRRILQNLTDTENNL